MSAQASASSAPAFGSPDLRLPDEIRGPLLEHLGHLRERYLARGWAGRVGFGCRPALIVIDLAKYWTKPQQQIGADLEAVMENAVKMLAAARAARIDPRRFKHRPNRSIG